ncbi:MAG: hypothetical protein IKU43_03490 [Clostridia bacterium]|nr:hypothetical protein [Clostridia bacterium]
MPKPMLIRPQVQTETQTQTNSILSTTQERKQTQQTQQIDKMKLDRLLRKPRSKGYMQTMTKLDSGGHVHNKKQVDDIIGAISEEFPDIEMTGILLGVVSTCFLGEPYEVHTLDITGQIIEHFKRGQPLPGLLENARSLAIRGGYAFIEVYIDCCRAVSPSGAVSVINF